MGAVDSEKQGVAKVQKTFYLNEELAQVVQGLAEGTGASFTKIVTAALLRHLYDLPQLTRARWMRHAVALEERTLPLAAILLRILDEKAEKLEESLKLYADAGLNDLAAEMRQRRKELKECRKMVQTDIEGAPNSTKLLIEIALGTESNI